MKQPMYAVRDIKAETFMLPFVLQNDQVATRTFADMLINDEHPFSKHARDYELYNIGDWDNESAQIDQHQIPKLLYNGQELREAYLQEMKRNEPQRSLFTGDELNEQVRNDPQVQSSSDD